MQTFSDTSEQPLKDILIAPGLTGLAVRWQR